MYTISIENTVVDNGQAYASVAFTRDTGEQEQYRELNMISPAVEQEVNEAGEIVIEAKEAVFEYGEILTRPKIEVIRKNIYFTTEEDLGNKTLAEKRRLVDLVNAVSTVSLGDYNPTETVIEATPEEMASYEQSRQDREAKVLFLEKLKEWDAQRVAGKFVEAYGGTIPEDDATAFAGLTTWLLQNMKAEYAVEAKPYLSALM